MQHIKKFLHLVKLILFLVLNILGKLLYEIMILDPKDKHHKIEMIIQNAKEIFSTTWLREKDFLEKEASMAKEDFKFKACDILKTANGSKAVEIALDLNDEDGLKKLLHVEKHCHPNSSRDAIRCFRRVIETDERSVKAVKILDEQYDPSMAAKYIVPIFSIVPLVLRFVSIVYDEVSDISLALNYHEMSKNLRV